MVKVDVVKGQRAIVSFSQLAGDLEDPDTGEKLKFEGADKGLPVFKAKTKEGREYTATLSSDNIRVEAGPKPEPKKAETGTKKADEKEEKESIFEELGLGKKKGK